MHPEYLLNGVGLEEWTQHLRHRELITKRPFPITLPSLPIHAET